MDLRPLHHFRVALAVALLCAVAPSAAARAPDAAALVRAFASDSALRGLSVGVAVAELPGGGVLAEHRADALLYPASGAKLLTVAAALRLLAADTVWTTSVHGALEGGHVNGPLVLVGGGDPKLMPADLTALADAVASRGVTSVQDGVIVDASRYDGACLPPGYDQKDTDAGYRASVGAAASNFGAIRVVVRGASKVGRAVRVSLDPPTEAVVLDVSARTVPGRGEGVEVTLSQQGDGRTQVRVTGSLGARRLGFDERRRIDDPDLLSGYLLSEALSRRGVEVAGPVRVRRSMTEPLPPELARHASASLAETIRDINTWSNNFMAETLFRELGRATPTAPANWTCARDTVTAALTELGLTPEQFEVVNGSGLYHATRISPRALVQLLTAMAADPDRADIFRDSLAVSGGPGTLGGRLTAPATRGRVQAKTGTLDEVISLSGYLTTRTNRRLAFAVLINDGSPARTPAMRAAIDRLIARLAEL
jgi:D-alanyl-D-alanine carboxypeptidase/D-alanyl-D-alanine-endopeptidase (penicillin-binding protein 4)